MMIETLKEKNNITSISEEKIIDLDIRWQKHFQNHQNHPSK